ncbi:hypothetical protein PENTCL1PPCAC_4226, partial [Pristionchus entomophagus]
STSSETTRFFFSVSGTTPRPSDRRRSSQISSARVPPRPNCKGEVDWPSSTWRCSPSSTSVSTSPLDSSTRPRSWRAVDHCGGRRRCRGRGDQGEDLLAR